MFEEIVTKNNSQVNEQRYLLEKINSGVLQKFKNKGGWFPKVARSTTFYCSLVCYIIRTLHKRFTSFDLKEKKKKKKGVYFHNFVRELNYDENKHFLTNKKSLGPKEIDTVDKEQKLSPINPKVSSGRVFEPPDRDNFIGFRPQRFFSYGSLMDAR